MYKNILVLEDGTELTAGPQDNAVKSLACTECTNADTELMPGTVGVAELALELYTTRDRPAAGDALTWLTEEDGVRTLRGRFWAEKPTRTSAHTCKVLAYDAAARTEKDLSPWLRSIQDRFPVSLLDFARAVCAQCGLELINTEIPNGDYQIQPFYADDLTARQLLTWVGQACGRFCRATPDGRLEFAWYTPPDWRHSVGAGEDGLMLVRLAGKTLRVADDAPPDDGPALYRIPYRQTWYYQDGLTFADYETAPIDKVQINQSESDVGVVWPADAAGTNALVISGNLLLTTDSDAALRPVAQTLYEQLREITYTPCRVTVPAGCGLRAGMAAWVTDVNGRTLLTCIMQSTVSGGRAVLESTGSARRDAGAAVNRQVQKNLRGKVLEVQAAVDGLDVKASDLDGRYSELSQTVDEFKVEVGNDYTKNDEIRTRFALDPTSVNIESGEIAFKSNTITIDSDHFTLTKDGTVAADGDFTSGDERHGDAITMRNGILRLVRDGQETVGFSTAAGGKVGLINLFDENGVLRIQAGGAGDMTFYDYDGTPSVLLSNAGIYFYAPSGSGFVTRLDAFIASIGSKFRPGEGKSEMYLDWTRVKGTDGKDYWALCGYDSPR